MTVDKIVDGTALDNNLTSVANAIRTKGGTSGSLSFPSGFVSAINALGGGGGASFKKVGSITGMEWLSSGGTRPRYNYNGPSSVQLSENHVAGDMYVLKHTSGTGIADSFFYLNNTDITAAYQYSGFYNSSNTAQYISVILTGVVGSNTLSLSSGNSNFEKSGINADIYKIHIG